MPRPLQLPSVASLFWYNFPAVFTLQETREFRVELAARGSDGKWENECRICSPPPQPTIPSPHFHGTLFCANFCSSYATGKLVSIFEGCREWRPQHFNLLSIIHMARPESRQRTMAERGTANELIKWLKQSALSAEKGERLMGK